MHYGQGLFVDLARIQSQSQPELPQQPLHYGQSRRWTAAQLWFPAQLMEGGDMSLDKNKPNLAGLKDRRMPPSQYW